MEKLYTIAEMAKLTAVPESTVRYYRDKYTEYFPYVGSGRKKRYKQEALEALRTIAECSNRSFSAEEIEDKLSIEFTKYIEVTEEVAITTAVEQQQYNNELSVIASALNVIADQDKRIKKLENDIEELRAMVKQQPQEEQQNKKTWLQRLFK